MDDINTPRELEKRAFMKAFNMYILPFVRETQNKEVLFHKDGFGSVYFEFTDDKNVKTIRRFEDDLMFAYNIAVEAIYTAAEKEGSQFQIMDKGDYSKVILKD